MNLETVQEMIGLNQVDESTKTLLIQDYLLFRMRWYWSGGTNTSRFWQETSLVARKLSKHSLCKPQHNFAWREIRLDMISSWKAKSAPKTTTNRTWEVPFVATTVGLGNQPPSGFVHRACRGSKNRAPNPQPIAARTTWHLLPKLHRRWSKGEWWNNIGLSSET